MEWIKGAEIEGSPRAPQPVVDAALVARGEALYAKLCASCHGDAGDGLGADALRPPSPTADSHAPGGDERPGPLDPRPRDFTKAVYRLRSTPSGSLPTDADLFRSISAGLHGSAMIPFVALEESDRWALVAKVKRFSARFARAERHAPIEVPPPPDETKELVADGRRLFVDLGCVPSHVHDGLGRHADGLVRAA